MTQNDFSIPGEEENQNGLSKIDMKQISSLLTAVALLCGAGMANGQESARFKAVKIEAEQGDAFAQLKLGLMYYAGEGVPKNYAEAVRWHRKAAEQGNADAQTSLGLMYRGGKGVPKSYVEAAKWFRKAAEQGHASAQVYLGGMYLEGEGVPKNDIEAYAWVLLAKANGEEVSEVISPLEKLLTAEQMEKGQARALELHRLIEQQSAK